MLAGILFSILMVNSLEVGVAFGPTLPAGQLSTVYRPAASLSVLSNFNRLELSYSFAKFDNKISGNENLNLHSVILAYQYPFYTNDKQKLYGQIGTGYHGAVRTMQTNTEKGYGIGILYGIKYQHKLSDTRIQPGLTASLITDQIIQSRNWQTMQISSSAFVLKALVGIQIKLL
ncbi:MAG: hypothetical protein KGZ86_00215 [Candidatus Latescibacteria bacterium]|nr:hypothetical protein [Candidatus Latescibacterota bacterium]